VTALGLALAALAAVALNVGYLIQHAGLATAPAVRLSQPVSTLLALARNRRWLGGAIVTYTGVALNLAALSLAPLSLEQCVLAAGLVVVAVGHRRRRGIPARNEPLTIALGVAGLVLLALSTPAAEGHLRPSIAALLLFVALAAAAALAALASGVRHRAPAPAMLGLAAGLLYAGTTVSFKALTGALRVGEGLAGALPATALGLAALTTAAGFFAFQRGLQTGHPVPVVTLMTAGMNGGSILGGIIVFGEPLGGGASAPLHAAAFALLLAAGTLAARMLSAAAPGPGLAGSATPPPTPTAAPEPESRPPLALPARYGPRRPA
jgi:hypothetical protein